MFSEKQVMCEESSGSSPLNVTSFIFHEKEMGREKSVKSVDEEGG